MRTPRFARALLIALLLPVLTPPVARAAEPAAAEDPLREKTQEIERLKRELDAQERELERLRKDNERLKKSEQKEQKQRQAEEEKRLKQDLERLRRENERLRSATPSASNPVADSSPALQPLPRIETLPPLADDALVAAAELVGHFLAEPEAAARRYQGRTFRVKGEVDRFDRAMVTRDFTVMLRSPDRGTLLKFKFNYVGKYRTVFTAQDGRELVARDSRGGDFILLTAGEEVVLSGRFQGLKDGSLTFGAADISR